MGFLFISFDQKASATDVLLCGVVLSGKKRKSGQWEEKGEKAKEQGKKEPDGKKDYVPSVKIS